MSTLAKQADLAGPGIGDYTELEQVLPRDYAALLSPRETMVALFAAKRLIEDRLGLAQHKVETFIDQLRHFEGVKHRSFDAHSDNPCPAGGTGIGQEVVGE